MTRLLIVIATVVPAATGCAVGAEPGPDESPDPSSGVAESNTESKLLRKPGLGADGDSCTVRTGVPGTEKDGECCATADPKDCVIILKPMPGAFNKL